MRVFVAMPAGGRATSLLEFRGWDSSRRAGKWMMQVEMIKAAHALNKALKIATSDPAASIKRLRRYFPALPALGRFRWLHRNSATQY